MDHREKIMVRSLKKILECFGVYYHPWYRYKDVKRFLFLYDLFKQVPEGDIVECGVGEGRALVAFGAFVRREGKGRRVFGYDTFEGFPYGEKKGYFAVPIRQVERTIMYHGVHPYIILVKGIFEDILPSYSGSIAFLHIDADLGASYKTALIKLYDKMVKGGVIVFDEYGSEKWNDVKPAVDEFLGSRQKELRFFDDKAYFFK